MPETVTLRDSEGRAYGVPQERVASYLAQGFRPETSEEGIERIASDTFAEEHGGAGGAIGSAITGGLSGLTLGASDLALSGLGADRMVRHMEAEHPYATGGGMVAGALLPTVLTGGAAAGEEAAGIGARILAHSPAGLAGRAGRAVAELGEGAGLVGRVAAGTAGAAAEGALYGGGQYLTETALNDKPLSAEGFVAGMGHGALFAAPIGAGGTLASATLQRARALFPRSEVSAAAAAGVKEQASGALAQTVRDGDAMVQAAQRKLSDIDAGIGMAQTGETTTRRVFGGADPQALADQVSGAAARQEVAQALEGYQQARTQFEDWIATEADPAFAAAFGKLEENRPALDRMLAHADQGDLEDLLGTMRGGSRDEELQAAMRRTLDEPDVLGAGGIPVGEFGAPGARGIKTPEELQRALEGSAPEAAPAIAPEDATGAGGPRALRAQGTPPGGVPAQEIVERGMAEQPATAVGKRPAAAEPGRIEVNDVGGQRMRATMPDGSTRDLGTSGADDFLAEQMPPGFRPAKVQTHRDFIVEHGLPATAADVAKLDENAIYIAKPSEIAKHDVWGDPLKGANRERILKGWSEGEKLPPIDAFVTPEGRIYIEDGNHRLAAAALTDRPVAIRFKDGTGYRPHGEAAEIGARLRGETPGARLNREAGDDLLAALSGTKAAIDKGTELADIGGKEAAATRAEQLLRHPDTAERFMAKAGARDAAEGFRTKATGTDLDTFFRDLTAPKTRDAYVAANIQRAMREEGSHAAALAKVEREWAERVTAELREERAAVLEYEGGHSRADAERMARDEVAKLTREHGTETASPGEPVVWESKKNLKRVEAAKKAADASVERLREIHSAVASNLPQELQTAWKEEGYKFLRDESARIRGMKDRINAASKISEAFTEKYGSASETMRGYEGDRFYRRAEIEAKHAESWVKEQERKYYAALERAAKATDPAERAAAEQESQVIKRQLTQVGARPGARAGAADAAQAFRAQALEAPAAAEPEVGDATMGRILAKHGLGEPAPPPTEPDSLAARILRNEGRPSAIAPTAPVSDAAVAGEGKLPGPMTKAEIAEQRARFRAIAPEQRAARAIMRHNGKGADMGPALAREAKVIGDMEGASARLADALGSEAPPTAVTSAKAFHEATAKAQERAAASSAKLGADLQNKVPAMTGGTHATVVDDDVAKALRRHESSAAAASAAPAAGAGGSGLGSKAADLGSALEVMRAIGMHVPAISHIPVIGPILGLWLKARAVMGILGRKGGSIGKSTEGLIASKAAAVQDRIAKATGALLEGGARAAGKASHLAGPAVLLAGSLFPGGGKSKGDDARDLFEARSNDITRAMQPGAIDQAIAQRFPTSDPAMHDAIVAQVQRGIAFLDSKRPKQTVLPGVLPGDGTWRPSMAAIDEFAKFVHAVNDPVSVLEDLAKGHPSAEGAETLRVVYPQLYQYAQKQLLAAAPEMARTLPYSRRVMLSILYQIPVDGTMQPSHAQFLQTPAPPAAAPKAPAITGPLRLGQQTLSPLDQRAGA